LKIVLATGNKGKLYEIRNIFCNTNFEIISLSDLGFTDDIKETENTFEGNAFIKADVIFKKFNIPVIADDSGLLVEQLNDEPGVYSARYAGENATYDDNNKKLLTELEGLPNPHLAKFVCCAVFVNGRNRLSVMSELRGEIVKIFTGANGFGYDPIFKPKNYSITLAEMSLEEKNRISHRAKAFNKLKEEIIKFISQQ